MTNTLVLFNCSPAIVDTIRTGLTGAVRTRICGSWDEVHGLMASGADLGIITELPGHAENNGTAECCHRVANGTLQNGHALPPVEHNLSGNRPEVGTGSAAEEISGSSLAERVDECERRIITETLQRFRNHRNATAAALGISRVTLYNKMKKFGML